jgi:hypothetical protein
MGKCVTGAGGIGWEAAALEQALRKLRGREARVERVGESKNRKVDGSTSSTLGMLRLFDCHLSRLAGSIFWQNQPSPVGRGCPDASGRVRGHVTRQSSLSLSRPQPEMFSSSPAFLSITMRGSVGRAAGYASLSLSLSRATQQAGYPKKPAICPTTCPGTALDHHGVIPAHARIQAILGSDNARERCHSRPDASGQAHAGIQVFVDPFRRGGWGTLSVS